MTVPTAPHRHHPLRWLAVLGAGVALYTTMMAALLITSDPVYVPSLLLLGAALVPVTFTVFLVGLQGADALPASRILTAAVLGGLTATVLAGPLEWATARQLGSLPTVAIGLIEETAKLTIPALLILGRRRVRAVDGLLLGVAVGGGFAALETMGYGFVTLLRSHGDLLTVTHLLLIRALTEPGGHAAWTGLACAALFAVRTSAHPALARVRFVLTFAGVVVLHALWDTLATSTGYLSIAVVSLALLLAATWYTHRGATRRPQMPPVPRPQVGWNGPQLPPAAPAPLAWQQPTGWRQSTGREFQVPAPPAGPARLR